MCVQLEKMLHSRKRSFRTFLTVHIVARSARPGGLRPLAAGCVFNPRIIYDDNESINNSRKIDTPRRGAQPPPGRSPEYHPPRAERAKRGWRRNARRNAPLNARTPHNHRPP